MKPLRRTLSLLLAALLLLGLLPAQAEKMAEYKDKVYGFQYPFEWKLESTEVGVMLLRIPDSPGNEIQTFGFRTDVVVLTGDEKTDEPVIKNMLAPHRGGTQSKLVIGEKVEMLNLGELRGFRAFGMEAGERKAEIVFLSNGARLISFTFIGDKALAVQESILSSLTLVEEEASSDKEGYLAFSKDRYTIIYPEGYGTMEEAQDMRFKSKTIKGNTIDIMMLDQQFSEAYALRLVSSIPPDPGMEKPEPQMVQIGSWNTARVSLQTSRGPRAVYVLGTGKAVMFLIFTGEDAVQHAETMIASITIEP